MWRFLCLWLFCLIPSVLSGPVVPVLAGDLLPPPRYTVDLDMPEETRWRPVLQHWNKTQYREMIRNQVLLKVMSPELLALLNVLASQIDYFLPSPYAGEIRGVANYFEMDIGEVVFLNVLYSFSATTTSCTSIVAQDSDGNIWHGRNLDFAFTEVLRNLTAEIDFQSKGKTLYTSTVFVGNVGAVTSQRPNGFTVSLNERHNGTLEENLIQILKALISRNTVFTSFQIRDALAAGDDFQSAMDRMTNKKETAPNYFIVGGVRAGEGAVITRDRLRALDVWRLNASAGRWFVLETNYDHWLPPPKTDDRRDAGNKAMEAIGQKNINLDNLLKVLSVTPVCRGETVYTTLMSAAHPGLYKTFIRRCG
ncbi:N-acylethanolamine-hydrolyzing acid amidase-like [Patiria miniata]|uniref:N-acylethanolamine-hydrolyzing acid amidase n=1 Tax=Patiria miniata TaxID=46514 RepID=A0A914A7R9_PATMI|nr:N-acylethanolamine-hydrolyzing acid amidase-like [Patiria miniata]